jgi:hypothetical protein
MRFTLAAIAQLAAVYFLIDALRHAGLPFGDCVDIILPAVLLANASGALMWSWAGPTVTRRS